MKKRAVIVSLIATSAVFAGLIYGLVIYKYFPIPCIFNCITGLECPGCGNTRAAVALLSFRFDEIAKYNLLFPLEMLYLCRVGLSTAKSYIKYGSVSYKPGYMFADIGILAVILLWGVVRNLI